MPNARPRIAILDTSCRDQDCERWPTFTYTDLPAISTDGRQLAVVEERDGWWHTPIPGVRILALGSMTESPRPDQAILGSRLLPLADPLKKRKVGGDENGPRAAILVNAANRVLAETVWRSLATQARERAYYPQHGKWIEGCWFNDSHNGAPNPPGRLDLEVDGLVVSVYAADPVCSLPWHEDTRYERVVISEDGRELSRYDATPWEKRASRCSSPHLQFVAASREYHVVLFIQRIGGTMHDCDGVPVPTDYRLIRW